MMEIRPLNDIDALVSVPGSKSYTQRALVIAALAHGESVLQRALPCEDSSYLIGALESLGARIVVKGGDVIVQGTGGGIATPTKPIFLGDNGTAMRLLSGVVCLGHGRYELTGSPRLCQRPVGPLLRALRSLGADARSKRGDGCPPVVIRAQGLHGGVAVLEELQSSQFLSSILISAPLASNETRIGLVGRIPSMPYVEMTIRVMEDFGVRVAAAGPDGYHVEGGQGYKARKYRIEGDLSSASYFFAAAALCGGRVRVGNLNPNSAQGDLGFLSILKAMGCHVNMGEDWIEVSRGGPLATGDMVLDLGDMPDVVPTLCVIAATRRGQTLIKGVGHLRVKESNRLAALVAELRKTGVGAEELEDGLLIRGGRAHGAQIETYNDHRMAMSFAILGLAVPGIRIEGAGCVKKSFPGFWLELEKLSSRP